MLKLARNIFFSSVLVSGVIATTPSLAEEVYLIRGFLNVFSDGMNQMTRQLKAKGIRAKAISNGDWRNVANDIIRRAKQKKVSYPIVIAGHSLGGVEAPRFANALGAAGVPVALVIGLDPGFASPPPFQKGVKHVVNYKIPSGQNYRRGSGFKGKISTIDVSKYGTDHVGIDKNKKVQSLVINRIRKTVRK
ncbi:MAG: lipase family protein [Rhizobiaceae bacterium]